MHRYVIQHNCLKKKFEKYVPENVANMLSGFLVGDVSKEAISTLPTIKLTKNRDNKTKIKTLTAKYDLSGTYENAFEIYQTILQSESLDIIRKLIEKNNIQVFYAELKINTWEHDPSIIVKVRSGSKPGREHPDDAPTLEIHWNVARIVKIRFKETTSPKRTNPESLQSQEIKKRTEINMCLNLPDSKKKKRKKNEKKKRASVNRGRNLPIF
jgi:hypothetical protein